MITLVTGITGHSGSYFYKELVNRKYHEHLKLIVRDETKNKSYMKDGLKTEVINGSLEDSLFLEQAINDVDIIFHIASIFYSENIVKAAIKNKVKTIVFVHTTGIFSKYKMASQEYKQIEENIKRLADTNSIKIIILRPTMIYGRLGDKNMEKFIKMVKKFPIMPVINHGTSNLQPVNGEDLGKAYYQVLTHIDTLSGDYILSGKNVITMKTLLATIANLLGKKIYFVSVPLYLGVFMAKIINLVTLGKIDYIERVLRMDEDRSYSHEKAGTSFGYKPMEFEEGLKREINEYLRVK